MFQVRNLAIFGGAVTAFLVSLMAMTTQPEAVHASDVDYDIVYVRAPRYGDDQMTRWPEVKDPILAEPGTDLMLLRPDGSEEVLVPGGNGAVVDPYVSLDGEWIYYSRFHDMRPSALNSQRRHASRAGADIFKIHVESREIIQLTHQEFTPNTGVAKWSEDHLRSGGSDTNYLGYGIFNLGPCPLPDGRVMFTSSRNAFLPNQTFTFPNLQLFVMDEDGRNVELVGHLNLGSALHPTLLMDGRVMFSSYEAQGLRDRRVWGLWAIWPDGRRWEPLVSAVNSPSAYHFQTQLSDGNIVVVEYYNQNNNGFGSLLAFPPKPPAGEAPFGAANPRDPSNPGIHQGYFTYPGKPQYSRYSFSPKGLFTLTPFTHGRDNAAPKDDKETWMGKVTHPSGAPDNDLLLVWSSGPANHLNRPTNRPVYDGGLYLMAGGKPAAHHTDLILIKDEPEYNEMQPRALSSFRDIYGIDEPANLPWLENNGLQHPELPESTPFGLVGSSSLYKRDTKPGIGSARFQGIGPFNTSQNGATSNWFSQGADAGIYGDEDIYALRVLAMEPTSHRSYGPGGSGNSRGYFNHAAERLRILGEVPVRKTGSDGRPVMDPDGNPDTSFLVKIPADTPFTFQTIDRDGLVLNMSQTWHQLRPGEERKDCGGCHAHAQVATPFESTAAALPGYEIQDLSQETPLLSKNGAGETVVDIANSNAMDVEYYRDIKPILRRSCAGCHSVDGPAEAGLVLDDDSIVNGYENTYNRLARDSEAKYGIKPVIRNGIWRQTNASRYIRMFQSRRSLLIWKVFGRRLDGFSNADHPTESVLGDASTLPEGANPNDADIDYIGTIMPPPGSDYPPLSEDEKMMFARWVDLGAPVSSHDPVRAESGWFVDDLRPTLHLEHPASGLNSEALTEILFGAFDYYSGLDRSAFKLTADFEVDGMPAGTDLAPALQEMGDHIWSLSLQQPISSLENGTVRLMVKDQQGNEMEIVRSFSIAAGSVPPTSIPPTAAPSTPIRPTAIPPTAIRPTSVPPEQEKGIYLPFAVDQF